MHLFNIGYRYRDILEANEIVLSVSNCLSAANLNPPNPKSQSILCENIFVLLCGQALNATTKDRAPEANEIGVFAYIASINLTLLPADSSNTGRFLPWKFISRAATGRNGQDQCNVDKFDYRIDTCYCVP